MSRGPYRFKQTDVARAIRGAQAAGVNITGVKIDTDGQITVLIGPGGTAVEKSELLDDWLRRKGDTDARSA
jgi:hypothetical protein